MLRGVYVEPYGTGLYPAGGRFASNTGLNLT
jgi:hypothetical protein